MKKTRKLLISVFVLILILSLGSLNPKAHVINSFLSLPETSGVFDDKLMTPDATGEIGEATLKRVSTDQWDVTVSYNGSDYTIKAVNLPYSNLRTNNTNGFYWTKDVDGVINRFLIYSSDGSFNDFKSVERALGDGEYKPFQIWTVWNLTTGQHQTQEKLKVFGAIKKSGTLYSLDLVLHVPTDDLLSVTLDYTYSETFLWVFGGKEYQKTYTAMMDEYYSNQNRAKVDGFKASDFFANIGFGLATIDYSQFIKRSQITKNVVTLNEKEDFMNRYNDYVFNENSYRAKNNKPKSDLELVDSVDKIFVDDHMYNIPLINKRNFLSTGIDFHDIVVVDLVYLFNGITYHVSGDDIDTFIPDYIAPNWFDDFIDSLKRFWADNKKWIIPTIIGLAIITGVGIIIYFFGPSIRQSITTATANRQKSKKKPSKKNKRK